MDTPTATTEVRLRGSLSATEVIGDRLNLWFDSPTGDTSDSLIYTMPCRSEAEAREINDLHRRTWGLEPQTYELVGQTSFSDEDTSEDLW